MSELKDIFVEEFIKDQSEYLRSVEEKITMCPMTYQSKIDELEKILKRGITFGIQKGVFLEQARIKKIEAVKKTKINRYVNEMFFKLNDDIMKYRNNPKVKYSKKKYKEMKKDRQLNFLKQLGFEEDII